MKRLATIIALTFCVRCGPCLKSPPDQPKAPSKVDGWQMSREAGVTYRAVLMLRKGESASNGSVGVRVTEIHEADPCCGDPSPLCARRASIQFFDPSDGRPLCEVESSDFGNTVIPCSDKIKVSVIGIRAINTQEGWVLFDLRV
jgi:hypothetical protein